jgi:hypothetical protein
VKWDVGRHCWYKFFPERRRAEAVLNGAVLFRSLAYFRDYEDAETRQIIGDRYEGTQTSMPEGGIIARAGETGVTVKFIDSSGSRLRGHSLCGDREQIGLFPTPDASASTGRRVCFRIGRIL